MNFNKKTEADKFVEKQAKKQAGKAGKKVGEAAGKLAAKIARKIASLIVGIAGFPIVMTVLAVIMFMMVLPSFIFSGATGMDGLHEDGTVIAPVDDYWEENAEAQLALRYSQLVSTSFWEGLSNFFSTGQWNDSSVETFKTEYANADDLDKNGKSLSTGYFSASNRLIAIINQAFITSKNDNITSSGSHYNSVAIRRAEKLAEEMKNSREPGSVYSQTVNDYPWVPPENITITSEKELNENEDFITQACYLVAACSQIANEYDLHDRVTKDTLDTVFAITGLDYDPENTTSKICWEPTVSWNTEYREVPETRIEKYWNPHQTLIAAGGTYADLDGDGKKEFIPEDVWQGGWEEREVSYIAYYIDIVFKYSIKLIDNYEELVDEYVGIDDVIPDGSSRFELTRKQMVQTSSTELLKFYKGFAGNLGVVGLPLTEYSYRIGEPFGCMCSAHAPKGHSGQDLPAPKGTGVFSVADGIIVKAQSGHSNNPGAGGMAAYGNCVFIQHTDESGNLYFTRYGHMDSVLVREGDTVHAGDAIGTVGNTGNSYGNHLHFEMLIGGNSPANRVDPMASEIGNLIREHAIS